MSDLARRKAWLLLGASVAVACAPKDERPPYTNSDHAGRTPPAVEPVLTGADAGETIVGSDAAATEVASTSEPDTPTPDPSAPLPDGSSRLHPWAGPSGLTGLERMIAASLAGEVYVSDGEAVFQVVDGEADVFVELGALGYEADYDLRGIGVDDEGNVHVFVQPTGEAALDHVLDPQGNAVEVVTISSTPISYPTVSSDGGVYFVDSEGVKVASEGSGRLIAGVEELGGVAATGCDAEALVVGPSNFYYLPGCEGSPIYFGLRDGSYNQLLVEINDVQTGVDHIVGKNHDYGFEGIAPHPLGGVVLNFQQLLLRIRDDGSWELYSTEPWPGRALDVGSPFTSSPLATDQSNVYLLASDQIWKVDSVLAP